MVIIDRYLVVNEFPLMAASGVQMALTKFMPLLERLFLNYSLKELGTKQIKR